jgi:hypothetical protein
MATLTLDMHKKMPATSAGMFSKHLEFLHSLFGGFLAEWWVSLT